MAPSPATTSDPRGEAGIPDIPADWTEPIARHQETIDLLAKETANEVLDAADLWDQRFAPVVAEAVEQYRAGAGS